MTSIQREFNRRMRYLLRYRGSRMHIYRHDMPALDGGHSAKCPCCQQYSLTYRWITNSFTCHVYGATITAEQLSQVTQSC